MNFSCRHELLLHHKSQLCISEATSHDVAWLHLHLIDTLYMLQAEVDDAQKDVDSLNLQVHRQANTLLHPRREQGRQEGLLRSLQLQLERRQDQAWRQAEAASEAPAAA